MSRQSPLRLFRHRRNEEEHLPPDFIETLAFIDPDSPEVAVIVKLCDIDDDPLTFYNVINHENLHTVFHRLGLDSLTNQKFDNFLVSPLHHYFSLQDLVFLRRLGL